MSLRSNSLADSCTNDGPGCLLRWWMWMWTWERTRFLDTFKHDGAYSVYADRATPATLNIHDGVENLIVIG